MAERVRGARRTLERLVGAGLRAASRARLPRHRGRWAVRGLAAEAVVRFDRFGVPHISGQTDADAFLAHGVVHALDRFFQMDIMRRVLAGRLAETVGVRSLGGRTYDLVPVGGTTADADLFVRHLDLPRAARRAVAAAAVDDRYLLEAYVCGVNAALGVLRRRRPLEHALLRLPLEPWTLEDSVLIAKGMALGLSFKWRTAPVYQAIADRLGAGRLGRDRPRLLETLLPGPVQPGDEALTRVVVGGIENALAFLPAGYGARGSNAFVVGGARAESGLPLLASDPHLELSLPSVWYLSAVRGTRYRAVGASLPGLPGIVVGRTPGVAWGLTNGMIDDADLWAEELDGTGTRYRVDGRWRPLSIETQELRRRGAPPLLIRLRRTHRGPILTDGVPGWTGAPLSLRLTLHEPAGELQAFLGLGRARSAAEVPPAIAPFGAPVQNLLFADTNGAGGQRLMGRVPLREAQTAHPALVLDGRDPATDWRGWIPAAELPALDLGSDDAIVSANEPLVVGAYPYYLSHLYEPPYRARRLRELLAEADEGALTTADLTAMQLDCRNIATRWFREHVLLPHAEAVRRIRPGSGRLIDQLLAWDGREKADAVGPALWNLTYHHLLRRTFGPALGGELLDRWLGLYNLVDGALHRAFTDPTSPWAPPESRAALVARALEDAERDLTARGLDERTPWGAVHTVLLRHPLSSVPVVGAAFTRGPLPLRGGSFAPSSGHFSHRRPARVTSGPTYRHVVDLADPERRSSMITFGGQSGHLGSKHYDDLTARWDAGKGLPMRLDAAPSATWVRDVLHLEPA